MHNAILQRAFPPALGTRHLPTQMYYNSQKSKYSSPICFTYLLCMISHTHKELPYQTEPKPNAVCFVPLLRLHHLNHHHHSHSVGAHRHHPLQHHFEQLQQEYLLVCLGKKKGSYNFRETNLCHTNFNHFKLLPLGAGVLAML